MTAKPCSLHRGSGVGRVPLVFKASRNSASRFRELTGNLLLLDCGLEFLLLESPVRPGLDWGTGVDAGGADASSGVRYTSSSPVLFKETVLSIGLYPRACTLMRTSLVSSGRVT